MKLAQMEFLLEVRRFGQTCLFTLSWGQGQSLDTEMAFPEALFQHYQNWADAYHQYYVHHPRSHRGRPGITASIPAKVVNWETRLNFTQDQLVSEFRDWLRGRELFDIRQTLENAAKNHAAINLLIQCKDHVNSDDDRALEKLPWECLGQELSDRGVIQVLRTTHQRPVHVKRSSRRRLRILAIFGDDTGLDFASERDAIEQILKPIAHVQFAGHNLSPTQPGTNLKAQISQAIADPQGWDILFFAGHSDDTIGGELLLAPNYSARISEFEDALKIARDRGLQFALFNSCRGCAIAQALVSYGLSHVVVMRERVTNQVAQIFFQNFAEQLANLTDVQTAALNAVKALATQAHEHYRYPSAHLVPSIYAYVGVEPLTPPPMNGRVLLTKLNPRRREIVGLLGLAFLSSQPTIQNALTDWRQFTQVVYRDVLGLVIPAPSPAPPILLVKLDDASLNAAKVVQKSPIDRAYLAKLVKKSIDLNVKTVGIDYVLKDFQPQEIELAKALNQRQRTRFVFGVSYDFGKTRDEILPAADRSDGDIDINITLGNQQPVFLARTIGDPSTFENPPHPFAQQIYCQHQQQKNNCTIPDFRSYYHPVTALSQWFGQHWLNPWIDYSHQSLQVYETISAQEFLTRKQIRPAIVLFIPSSNEFDQSPKPKAIVDRLDTQISGGEIHAYSLYNLLRNRLIIPIPDIWMIGVFGAIGKLISESLRERPRQIKISKKTWLILLGILPVIFCIVGWQTYLLIGMAIPLLFPLVTYFGYLLPEYWRSR